MTPQRNIIPQDLEFRIDSDPAQLAPVRRQIEQFAAACGFAPRSCDEIGLCVNEALANVIRHAYDEKAGQPIVMCAAFSDEALCITIRDWGKGVDPTCCAQAPYDPLTPGGVGLICLRQLMDQVTFTPQQPGMLLTMVRKKRPDDSSL